MTCITCRDGAMAADTRSCRGDWITPYRETKIRRLPSGALVGLSGDAHWWDRMIAHIVDGAAFPDWKEDAFGLLMQPDGSMHVLQTAGMREISAPFAALGSGAPAAWAAMYMGADARRAVEVAAMIDPYTGGEIDELLLDGATAGRLSSVRVRLRAEELRADLIRRSAS